MKMFYRLFFASVAFGFVLSQTAAQSKPTQVDSLLKAALAKCRQDYKGAVNDALRATELARNSNVNDLALSHLMTGFAYESGLKMDEALPFYKQALALENQILDKTRMEIYSNWAEYNRKTGNYEITKDYYKRILDWAIQNHDLKMEAAAYNGYGVLFDLISTPEQAIVYILKELAIEEKLKDSTAMSLSYRNLALTQMGIRQFEAARKNIEKGIALNEVRRDSYELSATLFINAKLLFAEKRHLESLLQCQSVLPMLKKHNEKRKVLDCWMHIGSNFAELDELQKAKEQFDLCLENSESIEYKVRPIFYFRLGQYYAKTGEVKKAIAAYNESLEIAEKRNFKIQIRDIQFSLSALYAQTGDDRKSREFLFLAYMRSDSLHQAEMSMNLAEAQYKYDFDKSDKEAQLFKLKQDKITGLGLAAVFFLLVIVLIYILKTRKKTNLALQQKNEEINFQNRRLAESNEILQQLAYVSAHDLKEPLRSISGFINIIQKRYVSQLPPEAHEYMAFVTTGVKRMESLLAALLHYSTVALQDQQLQQNTAIREVIQEVEETMQPFILEKKAVIRYPSVMPTVNMNRVHLTQILENLISNSMKFNEKTPEIKIDFRTEKNDFILSIKDNGIGLKAEYGNKIFKLFQRLDRTEGDEAAGVGLSLCKNIVDKYNGKIWFDSEIGQGTIFYLSFPKNVLEVDKMSKQKIIATKDFKGAEITV